MATTPVESTQEDADTSTKTEEASGAAVAPEIDPKHEAQLAFLAGEEGSAPESEPADEAEPEAQATAGADPEAKLAFLAGEVDETKAPAASADQKKETKDTPTAADVVAADEAATAAAKTGDKPVAKTEPAIGDEPAGLDEVEKAIKGKAQTAFVELRKAGKQLRERLKTTSEELGKEREWADHGRGFVKMFQEREALPDFEGVTDDQHVGVVRIQAALNRVAQAQQAGQATSEADAKTVQDAFERLAPLVKAKPAAALEPFTGELPADLRDLVDGGLLPEQDARDLQAAKLARAGAIAKAKEGQAKAAQPPVVAAPVAKAAAPVQQPQRKEAAPVADTERMQAAKDMRDYLVGKGVQESAIVDHFGAVIQPALIKELGPMAAKTGESAMDLFYRLKPQAQLNLIKIAQESVAEAKPAQGTGVAQVAVKTPRRHAPLFQRTLGSGDRPRISTGSADHAMRAKNTQAYMAGEP